MLGTGLIKGMVETARNFAGSYVSDERLTTLQYPEERDTPKENTRQFPFLVYDGDDWQKGLRCVACQICEKECPPQCIYIEKSKDKKPDHVGKPQLYPAVFDIDISVCMSCQICVEVCPFEAIKMDQEFELSTTDRFGGLLLDKEKLAKPNSHFQHLHPTDASEIDAKRVAEVAKAKADAEAKAKAAAAAAAAKAAAPASATAPVGSTVAQPAAPATPAAAPTKEAAKP
ncbi:MAG: 4Fe-4S dicluster domain-containing protein [Verrucomicrobia bacterium]|nr:4Fe-4S dicluster domain-containing protein [Verrucomicrobiota bacterium]